MARLALFTILFLFQFSISIATDTTCATFLDSVYSYLDSIPHIKKELLPQLSQWDESTQKIEIAPDEYKEFQIHLRNCLLPRFTPTERLGNLERLITYKLSEEVKQYVYRPYPKDSLHSIFQQITDHNFYSDSVVIKEKYWADSDRLIVVIGQSHSATGSEHEKKIVTQVQSEIFELYKNLYNTGIDLLIEEGFYMREIDLRIPTKSPRSEIAQNIDKKSTFLFDSLFDVLVYGFENKELYQKADSAVKTPYALIDYIHKDSTNFPQSRAAFISNFHHFTKEALRTSPEYFIKNRDTAIMFANVRQALQDYDTIDSKTAFSISNNLLCNANEITLNERNSCAVQATLKAFECTNRNIAMMKIGDAHLNKEIIGLKNIGFSDRLKSIQDYCREAHISYVYIVTKTQSLRYSNF